MFYSSFLKPKFKNLIRAVAVLILTTFSISLSGCYSYKTEYCSPEELKTKDDEYTIKELQTKKDSLINLDRADIVSIEKPVKSSKYLTWSQISFDTVFSKIAPVKEITTQFKIKLDEIKKAKVKTKKFDQPKLLLTIGIALIAVIIISYFIGRGMQRVWN